MGLFQRTSLDESEKRLFDELWRRYQDNPNDFTETQGNVLTEINKNQNNSGILLILLDNLI